MLQNLRKIDLNLLVVLQVLFETRSVSVAASQLNLTQSAVSHALARLRHMFDDALFIRTPQGLLPTEKAERLRKSLHDLLEDASALVRGGVGFDPLKSTRHFLVAVMAHSAYSVLPDLIVKLRNSAPDITITTIYVSPYESMEEIERLRADMLIGGLPSLYKHYNQEAIYQDYAVVAGHKNNVLMRKKSLSLKDYLAARHVTMSLGGERQNFVDAILEKHGHHRHTVVSLVDYTIALEILRDRPDLIGTLPKSICDRYAKQYNLLVHKAPFEYRPMPISISWHRRFENDAGHQFLREEIKSLFH
ncbi:MAG: LysR family transcriptional regulator [Alphaproteobacteria bacterium]|nr:LysR family transcriptional regulator [Alphaproteobacteria bacterium]